MALDLDFDAIVLGAMSVEEVQRVVQTRGAAGWEISHAFQDKSEQKNMMGGVVYSHTVHYIYWKRARVTSPPAPNGGGDESPQG